MVLLFSVVGLSNLLQQKIQINRLLPILSLVTLIGFCLGLLNLGRMSAFFIFSIKEVYIVVLLHLVLGHINHSMNQGQVKSLFGPLGALGSLAGILGGLTTTHLSAKLSSETLFLLGCFVIFLFFVPSFFLEPSEEVFEQRPSPLEAVKKVKGIVFVIALLIGISQVFTFLADLQFNLNFVKEVLVEDKRTAFLGRVYTWINVVTFLFQLVVIPFLLARFSGLKLFCKLPFLYLIASILLFIFQGEVAMVWPIFFVMVKSFDYSLFATFKEVIYHPLTLEEKFGTKYIVDMVSYRGAKAFIALLAASVMLKENALINMTQVFLLSAWVFVTFAFYNIYQRIISERSP